MQWIKQIEIIIGSFCEIPTSGEKAAKGKSLSILIIFKSFINSIQCGNFLSGKFLPFYFSMGNFIYTDKIS